MLHDEASGELKDTDSSVLTAPVGYHGLYALHKYWGKKPAEPLAFLIDALSQPGELLLDPFMGSGVAGLESCRLGRRFLGIDINPVAVAISRLMLAPPQYAELLAAYQQIERQVRSTIDAAYAIGASSAVASHYLWEATQMREIWQTTRGQRKRIVFPPSPLDIERSQAYAGYMSQFAGLAHFFTNSRINTHTGLSFADFFSGRAQRNIDLLVDAIRRQPLALQPALLLCLTAGSGQMSKMVFAIKRRGKIRGSAGNNCTEHKQVEVGSWVVGYWRPRLHFEINVWRCFEQRVTRLLKALATVPKSAVILASSATGLLQRNDGYYLLCEDALRRLPTLPDNSIDLIITDPPHGDRIPYLELSALWNAILGCVPVFEDEIVITNAYERAETSALYNRRLAEVWLECGRVLKPGRYMVILFNARQRKLWAHLQALTTHFAEIGHFPLRYSTGSVVQDSRAGSLKYDIALVLQKHDWNSQTADRQLTARLITLPGWDRTPLLD